MILKSTCKHIPLTTKHLSIAWCLACSDWQVRTSQSGRRDESGGIVLIESLQQGNLGRIGEHPDEMMWFWQQWFASAIELELDRVDFDSLRS